MERCRKNYPKDRNRPFQRLQHQIQAAHDRAAQDRAKPHQKFRDVIKDIGSSNLVSDPEVIAAAAEAESAAVNIQQELGTTIMTERLSLVERITNRD